MDGTAPIRVAVTARDVASAKKKNSKQCALSRAALRLPNVVAAYFFRTTAFLEFSDRLERFALPHSVQKEIVSFDRSQIFAEGTYQLSPPPPANRPPARQQRQNKQRAKVKKQRLKITRQIETTLGTTRSGPKMPDQETFGGRISKILANYVGNQAAQQMETAQKRHVHRTQYVRDLREP